MCATCREPASSEQFAASIGSYVRSAPIGPQPKCACPQCAAKSESEPRPPHLPNYLVIIGFGSASHREGGSRLQPNLVVLNSAGAAGCDWLIDLMLVLGGARRVSFDQRGARVVSDMSTKGEVNQLFGRNRAGRGRTHSSNRSVCMMSSAVGRAPRNNSIASDLSEFRHNRAFSGQGDHSNFCDKAVNKEVSLFILQHASRIVCHSRG